MDDKNNIYVVTYAAHEQEDLYFHTETYAFKDKQDAIAKFRMFAADLLETVKDDFAPKPSDEGWESAVTDFIDDNANKSEICVVLTHDDGITAYRIVWEQVRLN